jgi:hypothetical protein
VMIEMADKRSVYIKKILSSNSLIVCVMFVIHLFPNIGNYLSNLIWTAVWCLSLFRPLFVHYNLSYILLFTIISIASSFADVH